jgi:hypothetical protein
MIITQKISSLHRAGLPQAEDMMIMGPYGSFPLLANRKTEDYDERS